MSLSGVRVHLAGSVPQHAVEEQADAIRGFVSTLAARVFSAGGTVVHGSHHSLVPTLLEAARRYVEADGRRDALVLVRSRAFAETREQLDEIARQREVAAVEILPSTGGDHTQSLVPMREWMSRRSDVTVAVGGSWWRHNRDRAGVPAELDHALSVGHPGFIAAGLGGAIHDMYIDKPDVLSRLRNGWDRDQNQDFAKSTHVASMAKELVDQIARLPLVRNTTRTGRSFRILALDGGGIRGAFTAAVLAEWARQLEDGDHLANHFDLIAGTSTGAILALGLAYGLTPHELLDIYQTQGATIFANPGRTRGWLATKYDNTGLESVLRQHLEGRTLADANIRLVIPTVLGETGTARVLVTPHHADRQWSKDWTAIDAALSSAAAPTYFPTNEVDTGITTHPFIDGGLWANNPVLPAIAEAVGPLEQSLERVDVLSIGTTASFNDFTKGLDQGVAGLAPRLTGLFFACQESGAASLATRLLGHTRHMRVDRRTPKEIDLDDLSAVEALVKLGAEAGQESFIQARSRFLDGFYAPSWRD